VIVEPGTPKGYETILHARDLMIQKGAQIYAPCPHMMRCPLEQGDWCHFKTRLSRSSLHQYVKEAACGFEDEKFSYLIACKKRYPQTPYDRVLREPIHRSGHTLLTLCTHEGTVEKRTISRRDKELYAKAKRAKWGDAL
jgi:ribosomal protein RSM22 (predicted rRNA methylase)